MKRRYGIRAVCIVSDTKEISYWARLLASQTAELPTVKLDLDSLIKFFACTYMCLTRVFLLNQEVEPKIHTMSVPDRIIVNYYTDILQYLRLGRFHEASLMVFFKVGQEVKDGWFPISSGFLCNHGRIQRVKLFRVSFKAHSRPLNPSLLFFY